MAQIRSKITLRLFKSQPSVLISMVQIGSGPPWTMNWVHATGPRVHGNFPGVFGLKIIRKFLYCVINPNFSLKLIFYFWKMVFLHLNLQNLFYLYFSPCN